MTEVTQLAELADRMRAFHEEIKALAKSQGEAMVLEALAPLFALAPDAAVQWRQYTPGYCDGDPCSFTFSELGVVSGTVDEFGEFQSDGDDPLTPFSFEYSDRGDRPYYHDRILDLGIRIEDAKTIGQMLEEFEQQIHAVEMFCELAFGESSEVTVTPKGVYVEKYWPGY